MLIHTGRYAPSPTVLSTVAASVTPAVGRNESTRRGRLSYIRMLDRRWPDDVAAPLEAEGDGRRSCGNIRSGVPSEGRKARTTGGTRSVLDPGDEQDRGRV